MLYIVEIPLGVDPKRFEHNVTQMRTWLDQMGYQPLSFRHVSDAQVCRVDFDHRAQALAFTNAFSGHLLGASAA